MTAAAANPAAGAPFTADTLPAPMADLSTKSDPLNLRNERPDYVQDRVGKGNQDGRDASEATASTVNSEDPADPGTVDAVEKPVVSLDPAAVAKAEAEGKGFDT